jgi:hypothetical protein
VARHHRLELQAERGRDPAATESHHGTTDLFRTVAKPFDADEIEHMDPDNWDWDDPLEGVTVGDPRAILRIPFSFDEVDALFQVARARGLTTEELVRQLAVDALHAARA